MGCDIHMVAQFKNGDEWQTAKWPNEYFGKWADASEETVEVYDGRNYDLFAMLASVRNGEGFAGIDTGNGFVPISKPKGFPEGFVLIDGSHEDAWMGEHSFSWLSLAELEAYDWDQTTKKRGLINGHERLAMKQRGDKHPHTWCGDASGGRVRKVTLEELDAILGRDETPLGCLWHTYARMEWEVTYREASREFTTKTLPRLRGLGAPEGVRIVFGFDS